MTSARLDAFSRGAICALAENGFERTEIQKQVFKKDGTNPHIRAVDGVLAKKREDPNWRGQDSQAVSIMQAEQLSSHVRTRDL